jgi:hypothetical protein
MAITRVVPELQYNEKYHHLLNWIEDFYIEERLVQEYPYLSDIVNCLKLITFTYNLDDVDKAFHHYYIKGSASPSLSAMDAYKFTNYITTLLNYRSDYSFGTMPISLLSSKSNGTKFIKTFIEFYNFCVTLNIFPDENIPPLSMPTNILQPNSNSNPNSNPSNNPNVTESQSGGPGNITPHTHLIGGYKEVFPDVDASSTEIFAEQFVSENKMIVEELANRSKVEATQSSLDGLFNAVFVDTSIIQNKVIVPNFFNPNRLLDRVLFKAPDKSFNNVSIYRDISGSTHGHTFELIDKVCQYLISKIPIAQHFYLYSSGDISILETTYVPWNTHKQVPDLYSLDPVYAQMDGGTNSGAIADVITEQLDDKWLNIIITDGDLCDLFQRDNINNLLKNIFIISVGRDVKEDGIDPSQIITIHNEADIERISNAILNMKGVQ